MICSIWELYRDAFTAAACVNPRANAAKCGRPCVELRLVEPGAGAVAGAVVCCWQVAGPICAFNNMRTGGAVCVATSTVHSKEHVSWVACQSR
jgi:hypothetical protein